MYKICNHFNLLTLHRHPLGPMLTTSAEDKYLVAVNVLEQTVDNMPME